jgi:DNA-binding MarR family transcriptional regulator
MTAMKKKEKTAQLIHQFTRIINKYMLIEKIPREFGTGIILYPSEIHTVEAIGESPGVNVTELAAGLGVSKAAVSQLLTKLERKALAKRFKNPGNNKEVCVALTPRGRIAFKEHAEYHRRMDMEIVAIFGAMNDERVIFFKTLLDDIESYTDNVLSERQEKKVRRSGR